MMYMEQIFIRILNMSFTAGIVILLVILLRFFLKGLPKIFSYLLWAVVLFRLICPISFSSAVSLLGVLRMPSTERGQIDYISEKIGFMEQPAALPAAENAIDADLSPAAENAVDPDLAPAAGDAMDVRLSPASTRNLADPMQVILFAGTCLWMSGILIMTACAMTAYRKLYKGLKDAVKEKDNIYYAPNITTPFVCGLFPPRIYLPGRLPDGSSVLGEREREYILLHEQIHIKRRDHFWRMLSFFALCIHWFNPLVWLAFFLSGKDIEMSCDEAVIRKLGNGVKKEYSASLLSLASGRHITPGIPLAFGEGETGGRIRNVLRYKKSAQITLCAAAVVCIAATVVLAANPRDGREDAPSEREAMDIYYGVVSEQENGAKKIVTIPGIGDVEMPEAKEVRADIKIEGFTGPKAGDLVEISFLKDKETVIQETEPASFSGPADIIAVRGQGFKLQHVENVDAYRLTMPLELVRGASTEDPVDKGMMLPSLGMYRYDNYESEENEQEKELITWVWQWGMNWMNDEAEAGMELSTDEVRTFLAGFGRDIVIEFDGGEA